MCGGASSPPSPARVPADVMHSRRLRTRAVVGRANGHLAPELGQRRLPEHDHAQVLPTGMLAALLDAHRGHAVAATGLRLDDVADLDRLDKVDIQPDGCASPGGHRPYLSRSATVPAGD